MSELHAANAAHAAGGAHAHHTPPQGFIRKHVFSLDHKVIGKQYYFLSLAAVVIEPLVQGAAGMVTAPEGFLRRVREVTAECDVLLIADEVAVGFGRTGTLFACAQEGVTPDYLYTVLGLPWLAPDITTAIVNGRQPEQLNAMTLMRRASRLPVDWTEQRSLLGFR